MKRASQKKTVEEFGVTIFDRVVIIYENAEPKDFTHPHPDVVSLISDPNYAKITCAANVGSTLYIMHSNIRTPKLEVYGKI